MEDHVFLWYVVIGILGLSIGSFYACLVQRYVQSQRLFTNRSACTSCGRTLSVQELIPVLSYCVLRGKCQSCKQHISIFYPIIELTSVILAYAIFEKYGFGHTGFFYLFVFGVLICAAFIDMQTYLLPDMCTIVAAFLLIPVGIFLDILPFRESFFGALLSGGMAYALYAYYLYIRKMHALGLGDVKFLFFLGALVGIHNVPYLFLYASVSALVFFCCYYCRHKYRNKQHKECQSDTIERVPMNIRELPIPFGPFLALSCVILLMS